MKEPVYAAAGNRYDCGMQYRRAGKSGILLPAVSLGLWHNFGDVDTLSLSQKKIHYAFDHGVTHFDLANNYGPSYGSAEETFGCIMQRSMAPYRDELFISTKAGHDMWEGPYGIWNSRKHLMASLDQSLKRMRLDYVDIFYSHRYDPETPLEETLQALTDIVRQGKALYVGLSKYPKEQLEIAYRFLKRTVPLACCIRDGTVCSTRQWKRRHPGGIGRTGKRIYRILSAGTGTPQRPLPERHSGRLPHCPGRIPEKRRP